MNHRLHLQSNCTSTKPTFDLPACYAPARIFLKHSSKVQGRSPSSRDICICRAFGRLCRSNLTVVRLASPDPVVVKAVARAQGWFEQLTTGKADSMAQIAVRESITDNYVSNLIHPAWLSPHQVDLILEGDPEATELGKNLMLTRKVDIIWRESGGDARVDVGNVSPRNVSRRYVLVPDLIFDTPRLPRFQPIKLNPAISRYFSPEPDPALVELSAANSFRVARPRMSPQGAKGPFSAM